MISLTSSQLLAHAGDIEERIIFITGGAAGFGKETALLAARHGAKVFIVDLKPDITLQTLEEIRRAGGTCNAPDSSVDVTKSSDLKNAFEDCVMVYGAAPDIVVANAGVNLPDYFEEEMEVAATPGTPAHPTPPRDLTLSVNLYGALLTCELAQEYWKNHPPTTGTARERRLIVLSSMGGMNGIPGATPYSASKHGVLGYWKGICESWAKTGQEEGFQFFAICPFFAKTRIFHPATLLLLAGVPLVPVPLIAKSMLYASTRPPMDKAAGGVILLPDHGDPAMASPDEYRPLSAAWTAQMEAHCSKTDAWFKVSAFTRIWRDIAQNYFDISGVNLAVRAAGVLCVVIALSVVAARIVHYVPAWVAVILGSIIGLLGRRTSGTKASRK